MGQKFAAYDATGTITGFYDTALCDVPDGVDAVRITDAQHRELLDGQATGKRAAIDTSGAPVLLDAAPLSREQLADAKRADRDAVLSATDWLIARHQDETFAGGDRTLTDDQLAGLLAYRKALRDLPLVDGWPDVGLPVQPDFVGLQENTSPGS
jgi:Phage tail assembly chaperone protein